MSRQRYVRAAAVALLSSAVLYSTTYAAPSDQGTFSTMQGVKAQALSVDEMQAITGELNAYNIAAALYAAADKLDKFPRLQTATTNLADYYFFNADTINARYAHLGILTPCTVSVCHQ